MFFWNHRWKLNDPSSNSFAIKCISISIIFLILHIMLLRISKACNLIKWNKLISSFATHKSYSKSFEKYQHSFLYSFKMKVQHTRIFCEQKVYVLDMDINFVSFFNIFCAWGGMLFHTVLNTRKALNLWQ